MPGSRKTGQLQIRVSQREKALLRRRARAAGMTMSEWVLSRVLPPLGERFQELVAELTRAERPGFVLAELGDFLARLSAPELALAVAEPPRVALSPYWKAYLAATLEWLAARSGAEPPAWTRDVGALAAPVFGSSLQSLRLHLLTHAPPPFRRRNLFVDASAGERV
jgi:uncharacterized protein (DUF1778 family)